MRHPTPQAVPCPTAGPDRAVDEAALPLPRVAPHGRRHPQAPPAGFPLRAGAGQPGCLRYSRCIACISCRTHVSEAAASASAALPCLRTSRARVLPPCRSSTASPRTHGAFASGWTRRRGSTSGCKSTRYSLLSEPSPPVALAQAAGPQPEMTPCEAARHWDGRMPVQQPPPAGSRSPPLGPPHTACSNEGAEQVLPEDVSGDYSELLSSSLFCLVIPGDGWSARMEDAMLHGWGGGRGWSARAGLPVGLVWAAWPPAART